MRNDASCTFEAGSGDKANSMNFLVTKQLPNQDDSMAQERKMGKVHTASQLEKKRLKSSNEVRNVRSRTTICRNNDPTMVPPDFGVKRSVTKIAHENVRPGNRTDRKCSFCARTGHTQRKCTTLQQYCSDQNQTPLPFKNIKLCQDLADDILSKDIYCFENLETIEKNSYSDSLPNPKRTQV